MIWRWAAHHPQFVWVPWQHLPIHHSHRFALRRCLRSSSVHLSWWHLEGGSLEDLLRDLHRTRAGNTKTPWLLCIGPYVSWLLRLKRIRQNQCESFEMIVLILLNIPDVAWSLKISESVVISLPLTGVIRPEILQKWKRVPGKGWNYWVQAVIDSKAETIEYRLLLTPTSFCYCCPGNKHICIYIWTYIYGHIYIYTHLFLNVSKWVL